MHVYMLLSSYMVAFIAFCAPEFYSILPSPFPLLKDPLLCILKIMSSKSDCLTEKWLISYCSAFEGLFCCMRWRASLEN